MRDPTDMSLRTTRSSIVKPRRVSSARRPSSAIPRLTEMKICLNDDTPDECLIDNSSAGLSEQTMNVYLRLKPRLTKSKRMKQIVDDTYVVTDSTSLVTKFPSLEASTNCTKKSKSPETPSRKFNFTRIFGPDITQLEFFEQTTKQRIVDFLGGESFTLMSYGTTNSGKTYTFHGTRESPGVIPRSIEFLFSGVNCTLTPWYKPANVCEVIALNEAGRSQESEARETLLASRSMEKATCEEAYGLLENSMKDDREYGKDGEAMYSVWLSFVEIYNDNIYDLLANDETRAKLMPLKLVVDKQGRPFVHGVRTICATTGLEAYRIMMAGRSRLTVGSASSNPLSSRSHSIFSVTLLKYTKERAPEEVEVSTMTFCDLAGTGRTRKSLSVGNELKEAKKINTSLLVLGRCLKGVSDSQTTRQSVDVVGPFRESKLTRLFQRGISGKENLCLVVNICTSADLYVETQAVLTFASMAKKIIMETGNDVKQSHIPGSVISSPKSPLIPEWKRPTTVAVIETTDRPEVTNKPEVEALKERNVTLTKEITILREVALNREYEIRQEMANLYARIIKDVEANWQKRTKDVEEEKDDFLKWSVKQIEIFYKERIDSLTNRKRRRISGGDQLDDGRELCEELEAENSQITAKVVALRQTVKKLKEEQENLSAEKNKCVFELSLARDVIKQVRRLVDEDRGEKIVTSENDEAKIIDDLKSLIDEKNKTIKGLKKMFEDSYNQQIESSPNPTDNAQDLGSQRASPSILSSLTQEQLKNELASRAKVTCDADHSISIQILGGSIEIEDKDTDVKFSASTFKNNNRNVFLPSSTRYSIVEAENSIVSEETTCRMDSTVSSRYSSHQNEDSTKNLHISFLETIDNVFCSSIEASSKDDSGIVISSLISSSTENSLNHVTDEKSSQTDYESIEKNARINEIIQERVEQLKIDYTKLKAEHFRETIRVTELSQELESIQRSLGELRESTRQNELKILDYQEKLASRERDLSTLGQAKFDVEKQLHDVSRQSESRSNAYVEKIAELRDELKIREKKENHALESLEECREKSSTLESQLTIAHGQIDKNSIKCYTEHVPKIEKLEKELSERSHELNELNEKMAKFESDLTRVYKLNERVNHFTQIFEEYEWENDELRRQLRERSEMQTSLDGKITKLTGKLQERENEISSLRTDLGNVVKMNMENSERARDLSKEMAVANGRLASVRAEMTRSEEERRNLERTSGHEIGTLIARLADFEKNATILARMRDNEDSRMDELETLKLLLHEKEREMCLFKKNRDKTIRRYEVLIRKLQADVEMRCNRESSKLRMLYPKRSISKDSLRSVAGSLRWKTTVRRSAEKVGSSQVVASPRMCRRWQSADRDNHRCSRSHPTRSTIVRRSSSQALAASSTSLEGSRSSGSKKFHFRYVDDEEAVGHEIIETESRTELNLDIIECRGCGRRDGLSQAAATFSIPSTSDESTADFCDVPEWMEIRRTNGRAHFHVLKGDSGIAS